MGIQRSERTPDSGSRWLRPHMVVVVYILGAALTVYSTWHAVQMAQTSHKTSVNLTAARLVRTISLYFSLVERDVVASAAWASNSQVLHPASFLEFRKRSLELSGADHFRAIAIAPVYKKDGPQLAEQFVAGMRQDYDAVGYGAFTRFPEHTGDISAPLILIEPAGIRGLLFGFDIGRGASAARAVEAALATGSPRLDGPYVLREDKLAGRSDPSFLIYAPVQMPETSELPWEDMVVVAPVTPAHLLSTLVDAGMYDGCRIEISIDGKDTPSISYNFPVDAGTSFVSFGRSPIVAPEADLTIGGHKLSFKVVRELGFSVREVAGILGLAILLGALTFLSAIFLSRLIRQRETIAAELETRKSALEESERRLMRAEKLEALGEFVGGVAHDFNNILSVTLFNAEMLERRNLDAPGRRYVQAIVRSAERGASLSRNLLAFGRRSRLEPELSDVRAVMGETVDLFRHLLPESIDVQVSSEEDLWTINVDRNQLETSLLNLALNARHAMPDGGSLLLEAQNVAFDEDDEAFADGLPAGNYVSIAVTDTGCGMDKELVSRAFEPFFTTKSASEGNGMGLAMVLGFAQQSGGAARIYSEVAAGTTVKLYFPVDERVKPEVQRSVVEHAPCDRNSQVVLLVEDEAAVRQGIAHQLENAGFKVTMAESGDVALKRVKEGLRPTVLISDIVMPGSLQGPDLARDARSLINGLPVIFMSGYPKEAAIEGHGVPPSEILLQKPFSGTVLINAICKVLDRP